MTHFYDTDNGPFRNRDVSVVTNGKKEAGAAGNNRRRETRERTNTNMKDHHVVTETLEITNIIPNINPKKALKRFQRCAA